METVLCAAVDRARHQRGLEASTVYGDRNVCSCRQSKASAWVRSTSVYGRFESKYNKSVPICTTVAGINILNDFV